MVHGTFAGNDIVGILREVARISPRLADSVRSVGKNLFDQLAGDLGNYTQDFANRFERLINDDSHGSLFIPVTRFNWSGENHHLGRAGGAIELLDKLSSSKYNPNSRVLIWAHSHGGNLVAMMGHLIAANAADRQEFFAATRSHYRDPVLGRIDLPLWEEIKDRMSDAKFRDTLPAIDVATFGTPLRYRWNTEVFPNLLHFVQHRPTNETDPSQGALPISVQDILQATGGDYVQQLGIGGTDFLHSIIAWRSWNSERRLRAMFEPSNRRPGSREELAKRLPSFARWSYVACGLPSNATELASKAGWSWRVHAPRVARISSGGSCEAVLLIRPTSFRMAALPQARRASSDVALLGRRSYSP